jgi:hypothetical protein
LPARTAAWPASCPMARPTKVGGRSSTSPRRADVPAPQTWRSGTGSARCAPGSARPGERSIRIGLRPTHEA